MRKRERENSCLTFFLFCSQQENRSSYLREQLLTFHGFTQKGNSHTHKYTASAIRVQHLFAFARCCHLIKRNAINDDHFRDGCVLVVHLWHLRADNIGILICTPFPTIPEHSIRVFYSAGVCIQQKAEKILISKPSTIQPNNRVNSKIFWEYRSRDISFPRNGYERTTFENICKRYDVSK